MKKKSHEPKRKNLIKKLESSREKFIRQELDQSIVDKMREYSNDFNKQYVYGVDPFDKDTKPSKAEFIYFDEQWNK